MINFEFPEDRKYFADLLTNGDVDKLENNFSDKELYERLLNNS